MCITELVDGQVNVLRADEYLRPDFNEMIETTLRLQDEYDISFQNRCRMFVDGDNPSFIRALKDRIGEDSDYERHISLLKTNIGANKFNLESLIYNIFVVPVNFSTEHKKMLAHCKQLLELNGGCVAIDEHRHSKLIPAQRTAVEKGDETLDKEATSHDDYLDAFRLSMQFWH